MIGTHCIITSATMKFSLAESGFDSSELCIRCGSTSFAAAVLWASFFWRQAILPHLRSQDWAANQRGAVRHGESAKGHECGGTGDDALCARPGEGKEFLSRLPGSEALFITLHPDRPRGFRVSVTPGFQKILKWKSRQRSLPKKSGG